MYRTALSFRLSQAMYHDGCQIRHVKWYNINGICSRHRLILNKQLTSVSNSPCLIHNLSYVYVSTVLEPPLLSLFWALICKHFFFFVSKRGKKKAPGNDQYTLSMMNRYHFISNSKKNVQKEKKNLPLKCIHKYLQNQKQEEKSIHTCRPSQTKPSVEF